jgi:hypothetical protein
VCGVSGGGLGYKKAALFCKKARKKRLLIWDWGFGVDAAHGPELQKFFGSFFQKRTASNLR